MIVREIPFTKASGWMLMPPAPGLCQECAVQHQPDQPHNQQSLHYQYHFQLEHGRWPTWLDAMSHCTREVRALWLTELENRGIRVLPLYHNWGNPERWYE